MLDWPDRPPSWFTPVGAIPPCHGFMPPPPPSKEPRPPSPPPPKEPRPPSLPPPKEPRPPSPPKLFCGLLFIPPPPPKLLEFLGLLESFLRLYILCKKESL
ncbi:hypothetical protein LSTR_LSTR015910 [Laodelphax striatellus]|uniref:Uncharacterized protein n=1 Tax=Laodelphax striatellus TaxID=195883 RepID=A0A482WVE8_LAOST|nr:hypothetical protein LSTR_LSTR015910 [Laodelphax striatellus]